MELDEFVEKKLGIEFKHPELLTTALTHRSWLNEQRRERGLEHNERLEFLGDAVLELVTTDYLFNNYKDQQEGVLTNWRAALVRTESIGAASEKLGVWDVMHMSRGERRGGPRARTQILANAFESITGAIYLDQGYDAAEKFITDNILVTLEEILKTGSWQDAKSTYQEKIQADEGATPTYKVLDESGPDHDKIFTVGVYINEDQRGIGKGASKQLAQQAAAEVALTKLQ
ncbi:ribonuclease III [Candidatus Saccharibacteria bacterium]|nr:ribonuclease III [Candidatus Saccharibacteria bacterium]